MYAVVSGSLDTTALVWNISKVKVLKKIEGIDEVPSFNSC